MKRAYAEARLVGRTITSVQLSPLALMLDDGTQVGFGVEELGDDYEVSVEFYGQARAVLTEKQERKLVASLLREVAWLRQRAVPITRGKASRASKAIEAWEKHSDALDALLQRYEDNIAAKKQGE